MNRTFIHFLIILIICTPFVAADTDPALTTKLDHDLSTYASNGATYVARVVDVSTGRELYLHDPDRPVAPASNAKLPNLAAGLDRFGPDYAWKTYLAVDGDNLWLIGTGDPSCGDRRIALSHNQKQMAILDDFADALLQHGITHLKGKLLFDDSIFDDQRVGASWPKSELTEYWSAPLTGLSLCDSCIQVTASTSRVEILPQSPSIKIIDHTRTTGKPEPLSIDRAPDSNTFTITGLLTKEDQIEQKAITDPGFFFADALRARLAEKGITIDGPTERSAHPLADPHIIATHQTLMLDVLKRIGKQSQNLFADALCKLQGRAWDLDHNIHQPGNWDSGTKAIHDFLKRMQIDDSQYIAVDGSGLSSDNRVTARLLSDVLLKMLHHRYAKEYEQSLSICGVDGTLDDRMMDITGLVHGKSGTIDGVKALSGYLTTRTGQRLVFSMVFNNIPPKYEHRCADIMDNACRIMVDWKP
ncbi:MAG TPA: D-alanyl-D-alanine carboxypeptidase/D-alanyl-D-alanine-endopeptidase [Tepidisphaeraceae bacterium]|jgi:D-alanyl-D-alanine carboxypeptidase/D-alanyl-D-alanine-endopeptidase (penicillin-binding protein 4)|nr:D-alanyl-D-alanine carboxypeptidase/D-alanyl-D-alanine-endopeptidase [Tepidisphaeraceae bacterium]